jgi:hypothetical protein
MGWVERINAMNQMLMKHVLCPDYSIPCDSDRFNIISRPTGCECLSQIVIGYAAAPIELTELLVRQMSASAQKTLCFRNGFVKVKMLKTMERICMDEGADRSLFMKQFGCMGNHRTQNFSMSVCDGRGI